MKRPTFFEGVAIAVGASVFAGALFATLAGLFSGALALRLIITAISLGYILYLLRRSPERTGRVTTIAGWAAVSALAWFTLALPLYLAVQLGLVWLVRSLYFYASLLAALADLGLTGFGLAAAVWAATSTGSLFVSVWCFFLVQALFVAIPAHMRGPRANNSSQSNEPDNFARAHRIAEAAVRRLSSTH